MKSWHRMIRLGVAVWLAAAGLGWGGASAAGAEAGGRARQFDVLTARAAAAGGPLLVIVGVRVPDRPEAAESAQAAALAQAQDEVARTLTAAGGQLGYRYQSFPFISARVEAAGLAALRASPWVTSITEDQPDRLTLAESTAVIGASSPGTGAWARGFTGAGQTIAILDTGVDRNHPFLAGKVVAEACYSNAGGAGASQGGQSLCPGGANAVVATGAGAPCALSGCEHGTHVAGIAAGKAYPGMNVFGTAFSGVAPDAQVIAVQVFTNLPGGIGTYQSDQIAALDYINYSARLQFTIAAVNMSLGGSTPNASPCDAAETARAAAINRLRANGIATVIAAGNGNAQGVGYANGLSAPACISSAVSVGSTLDANFGPTTPVDSISSFSNSASYLSLLAPGELIRSAVPTSLFASGFGVEAGTSMAAPHVAGAWAVLRQARPAAAVPEILALLQSTGQPITDPRNGYTQSRLQLDAALASLGPRYVPASIDFGGVIVDLSSRRTLTLENPLGVPVTLSTPSLAGAGLTLAGNACPVNAALAAGGACTFEVQYAPTQLGALNGSVTVGYTPTTGSAAGALQAALAGAGVGVCPGNVVQNAVFERLDNSWVQTDTVAGAALPFCPGGCPVGGFAPAGPASGRGWALFGAYTSTVPTTLTQVLTQSVSVPAGPASLQFLFNISRADPGAGITDTFQALVDAAPVFTATAAQQSQYATYQTVRVELPAAASAITRTLTFSATTHTAGRVVDFNLDNIGLCTPAFFPIYLPTVAQGQ